MLSPWENDSFAESSLSRIDMKFKPNTVEQVDYVLEKLNVNEDAELLDLGCGAGRHSIELSKRGMNVTGIDISSKMLEQAKIRAQSEDVTVNFIKEDLGNIASLNLKQEHYNGAICLCESGIGVLGASGKDLEFFKNIYSLLKNNSRFIITCFNGLRRYIRSKDNNPIFDYLNGTLEWSANIEGEKLKETQRLYIPSEILLLLTTAGFNDIQFYSCTDVRFTNDKLGIEDIEMLIVAEKS